MMNRTIEEETLTTKTEDKTLVPINPCDKPSTYTMAPKPSKDPLTVMAWATGTPKDKFGCTRDAGKKFHAGIDIKAAIGTECYAVEDAKVEEVGSGDEVGLYVSLSYTRAGKTYGVAYCHLSKRSVTKGDSVKAGDVIGKTGTSGNAEVGNPHLHLEVQDQIWVAYADAESRAKHSLNSNSYME